jgi:hypothetical protein
MPTTVLSSHTVLLRHTGSGRRTPLARCVTSGLVGTGIIYAAIVVAWAAYLLPLVRHHREQPSATSPGRVTGAMRVLGKRSSGARTLDEPAEPDVAAAVEVSRPRYDAAARRRRVLFLILATAIVIGVFAFVGLVPWWSLAVPGGLLVGFVVLARLSVRAAHAARRRAKNQPVPESQPADNQVAAARTSRRARRHAPATTDTDALPVSAAAVTTPTAPTVADPATDPAAAWVAHSPVDAWDPLPVTLPTYVTKDAAPARRVRTIDLSGAAAFSAGRLPEAELLSRQPQTVQELSADERRSDDEGTAHSATG